MIEEREFDAIDKELMGRLGREPPFATQPNLESDWRVSILPALRASIRRNGGTVEQYAELWGGTRYVTSELFNALYSWVRFQNTTSTPQPHFWRHQPIEFFKDQYRRRGISIDKDALIRTATYYLSRPELRMDWLDWIFLDAFVLAEVIATSDFAIETIAGLPAFLAMQFARSDMKCYQRLKTEFRWVWFTFNYLAWPAAVYALFVQQRGTWALAIGVLWGLFQVARIVLGVSMRNHHRAAIKLVEPLRNLYAMLGGVNISPRKLKEALDTAAAAGVVFDGAAFAIVDRIIAADATVFIQPRNH